jgi:hypothetical protein
MGASVYSTAKLYVSDLRRFPMLRKREQDAVLSREGKAVFFLNAIFPDRLSSGFPIKAVLLPKYLGGRDTAMRRVSGSTALLLLGPVNVLRWPSIGRSAFIGIASALRSLPCFQFETGSDLSQIPKAIVSVLDMLPACQTA